MLKSAIEKSRNKFSKLNVKFRVQLYSNINSHTIEIFKKEKQFKKCGHTHISESELITQKSTLAFHLHELLHLQRMDELLLQQRKALFWMSLERPCVLQHGQHDLCLEFLHSTGHKLLGGQVCLFTFCPCAQPLSLSFAFVLYSLLFSSSAIRTLVGRSVGKRVI